MKQLGSIALAIFFLLLTWSGLVAGWETFKSSYGPSEALHSLTAKYISMFVCFGFAAIAAYLLYRMVRGIRGTRLSSSPPGSTASKVVSPTTQSAGNPQAPTVSLPSRHSYLMYALPVVLRLPWLIVALAVACLIIFKVTSQTAITQGRANYLAANTGVIAGFHTWCDDSHILAKRVERKNGLMLDVKGEFLYFDINSPDQPKIINLSSYGEDIYGIHSVGVPFCRGGEIIFYAYRQKPSPNGRVYSLSLDKDEPELLAQLPYGRDPSQMFQGSARYMLATRKTKGGEAISDRHLNPADCEVAHVSLGYRVTCVDGVGPASKAAPYVVVDEDYDHSLLRSTTYELIADLSKDASFQIASPVSTPKAISPDGKYLYSPCEKRKETIATTMLSICRYLLDGKQNNWELVFTFNPTVYERALFCNYSLAWHIIPTNSGDVYFVPSVTFLIAYGSSGMWKYSADEKEFIKVSEAEEHKFVGVSPGGKRISVQGEDKTIYVYEERVRS